MNLSRVAPQAEKVFAHGPFAGKKDCWYEHVPICHDDPRCSRSHCPLSHPARDAKGVQWQWVYPLEWFESRPTKEALPPPPAERVHAEARQYWDQVDQDTRAFDPWGWNNATIRQNLSYTDHLATPVPTQAPVPKTPAPKAPKAKRIPKPTPIASTQITRSPESKEDRAADIPLPAVPAVPVSAPQPPIEAPPPAEIIITKSEKYPPSSTLQSLVDIPSSKEDKRLLYVEMSDEDSPASEALGFTLRGGRADSASRARHSMPENQPLVDPMKEIPTGCWGRVMLFLAAIWAFFVAVGEAIFEGTGACFFRLGDFFVSKSSHAAGGKRKARGRRSPQGWKKRSE